MKPSNILNPHRIMITVLLSVIGTAIAGAAILRVVFRQERPERIMVERRLTDRENPYSYHYFRDTVTVRDSVVQLRLNITQPYDISVRAIGSDRPGSRVVPIGTDDELTLTIDSLIERGHYSGTEFTDSLYSFFRQESEFLKRNENSGENMMALRDRFLGPFALSHKATPAGIIALSYSSDSVKARYFDELDPALEYSVAANEYVSLRNRARAVQAIINARSGMTVGKVMPDFALPDSTGRIVTLSSMRGGWVLVDFWATWCAVCIRGFADLRQFSAECGDRCKVVTIDIDDQDVIWRPFIAGHDMPWINLLNDPTDHSESNPVNALGINSIPVTMLIDPDGKIAALERGSKPGFLDKVKHIIGIN